MVSWQIAHMVAHIRKPLIVAVVLLYWYLASFVLMMDCRCGAIDPAGRWVSQSHYRLADNERVAGDLSVYGPAACWANDLFWPLDAVLGWLRDESQNT